MKQAEKMAEEYLRKGDKWVKDAEKWMGEAVKVVPPDSDGQTYVATSWDGGDFYSFSTSAASVDPVLFDAAPRTPRSTGISGAAGSRKEALLQRLREDHNLLLVDPESPEQSSDRRAEFAHWVKEQWPLLADKDKDPEVGHVGAIRMALGRLSVSLASQC
jgi:hypothetical protein